jgi:chemotaxis protein methyltransferase CheR
MKDSIPLSTKDFGLFQELLIETCGIQFEEDRSQSLQDALLERLQHRGYDSYQEYYNLLKFHPEGRLEIRELLDLITIGETYFFRNRAQFNVLMKFVLPEIIQRKEHAQDRCMRIWSAGCSRGDEPYSIAIAIMEVLPSLNEWRISILGTDINRNGLACAKEAIYGEKDIVHLPKEYLDKYFKVQGSTYLLHPDVRKLVQLEYHNLVKDPFIDERMQNIDLIFCRNVTIYFNGKTTQQVIENFYNCLTEEGYLFLGHTETLWQIPNKFERVEFPQTFIYRKRLSGIQEDAMKPFMAIPETNINDLTQSMTLKCPSGSTLSGPQPSVVRVERSISGKDLAAEKSLFLEKQKVGRQEKPKFLVQIERPLDQDSPFSPDNMITQHQDRIFTYLNSATTLANEAKYKEAAEILAKVIEMDNLSVEAYYLLGVLSYKSGDFKKAEAQFRKVIYADPDLVLAYFNLGNIYLYQRNFNGAAREFRNATRLLEKRPKNEQVRFCEDFTVEFLLRACRNNLSEISKRGERYE